MQLTTTQKYLLAGSVLLLAYLFLQEMNKIPEGTPLQKAGDVLKGIINPQDKPQAQEENTIEMAGQLSELEAKLNGQIATTENRSDLQKRYDELKGKLGI